MAKYAFDLIRFAKEFHGARWGRGETTRSIAEKLGLSASTISRWERAKFEPAIVPFLHACGMLGLNPLDYIMEEKTPQAVLPGFEEIVQGELVSMSQLSFRDELEGVMDEGQVYDEEYWGDPSMPTRLNLEIGGGQTIEVWHQEIGWVLLPEDMTVEAWYQGHYDGSEELADGKLG